MDQDRHSYRPLLDLVRGTPVNRMSASYDDEADVLYVNFKKPSVATDSELTDDDMIVRYEDDEDVGLTILHASKRS